MVYEGAFAGTGHTTPVIWIGGGLTAARIPMAWLFDVWLGLGVTGIWVAIALSTVMKGVALRWWFHRGTAAARAVHMNR